MLEINKLNRTFLETTTLTITVAVDIGAGTNMGTLAVERLGNTEICKCTIRDVQFLGYLRLLPRGKSDRNVRLANHLPTLPGLTMNGATPPLPHMTAWCVYEQLYTVFV